MQKLVDFLEKHVQWVAIGLGGLYLLYMVWGYLILQPVTIAIPGAPDELTPGTIDQYTLENRIADLDAKMAAPKPVNFQVDDFSTAMMKTLAGDQAPVLEGPFVYSQGSKIEFQPDQGKQSVAQATGDKLKELPKLPAPVVTDQGAGRSSVIEVAQRGAGGRAPAAAAPNRGGARGGIGANAADQPDAHDQDWVTVFFKIPSQDLASAYAQANLKPELFGTVILDVELIREKQLSDGTWGEQTVIKVPADVSNVPQFPTSSNKAQQMAYADWAMRNNRNVLQPTFYYQIAKGDQWPPIELVDDQASADLLKKRQLDRQRRMEERKRQQEQQRKLQLQRRPTNNRRTPGGGRNVGPGGGPAGFFAPRDNDRSAASRRPQTAAPPMMPPGLDPMMGGLPPDMMPGGFPGLDLPGMMPGGGADRRQVNPKFKAPGLPPGEFDPTQLREDIQGWAHDITVQPGQVYRYQVRYKIRNPVFDMRGLVADPKLAEQFAIESPASEWSNEVEIEPLSYFFLASGKPPVGDEVRFDIFRSTGGSWEVHNFGAAPGDLLGQKIDDVDFTTGWTLVAVQTNRAGETEVLLVDDDGNMQTRSFTGDRANPTYNDLKQEIAEAEAAETRVRASAR